ncbi:DUF6134 family protein [Aquincola sp. J276]|uniref:DUF6134 family protein n=1 Tax=Aquincola sp. J276 TaxID=2898432 RepID=UPI002151E6CB|nr:DUF6134 family protein [Aquincola sp. J276]MCR5864686.1 DUF6134 family protein [Aquincola sp. J276]
MKAAASWAAVLLLAGAAQASTPPPGAARTAMTASPAEWHFEVQLDGKPVGEHRFSLSTEGSERRLRSIASFDVKLLGITVYRYRHEARERWKGDCLAELEARTDANGKPTTVSARLEPEGLRVSAPAGMAALPACTMTFAYWHPALRRQAQLLNPQTGRNVAVQMVPVGTGMIDVRGSAVPAEHWRLTGDESPIELWYTPGGEWLALDATVNGRRLSYRLR